MVFLVFLDVKDTNDTIIRERIIYHVLKEDVTFGDVHTFLRRVAKKVPELSPEIKYTNQLAKTTIDTSQKVKDVLKMSGTIVSVTIPATEPAPQPNINARSHPEQPPIPERFKTSSAENKKAMQEKMRESVTARNERVKAKLQARAIQAHQKRNKNKQSNSNPLITFSNAPPKAPPSN